MKQALAAVIETPALRRRTLPDGQLCGCQQLFALTSNRRIPQNLQPELPSHSSWIIRELTPRIGLIAGAFVNHSSAVRKRRGHEITVRLAGRIVVHPARMR